MTQFRVIFIQQIHYYSEVVFALTHLLGFFAPRIKNFKEQQLYAFEAKKSITN